MVFKYRFKHIQNTENTPAEEEVKETEEKNKWYNNEWLYFSLSPLLTMLMLAVIMGADFFKGLAENNFFTIGSGHINGFSQEHHLSFSQAHELYLGWEVTLQNILLDT